MSPDHEEKEPTYVRAPRIMHAYADLVCYVLITKMEKYVLERQEQEMKMLMEEYGPAWMVMSRTPLGSGYEVCSDILAELRRLRDSV